jgi:hypothetical protein
MPTRHNSHRRMNWLVSPLSSSERSSPRATCGRERHVQVRDWQECSVCAAGRLAASAHAAVQGHPGRAHSTVCPTGPRQPDAPSLAHPAQLRQPARLLGCGVRLAPRKDGPLVVPPELQALGMAAGAERRCCVALAAFRGPVALAVAATQDPITTAQSEALAHLCGRTQRSWVAEVDHGEELFQLVLHGRACEQHAPPARQRV